MAEHGNDFCPRYLRMSGTHADRIVRLLEEFGPEYFELSQLTRISPETYRAIQPALNDGVLTVNGKQIELTLENSRKVAAAVTELRRAKKRIEAIISLPDRIGRIDGLCDAIVAGFDDIPRHGEENLRRLRDALTRVSSSVSELVRLIPA